MASDCPACGAALYALPTICYRCRTPLLMGKWAMVKVRGSCTPLCEGCLSG